MGQKLRVFTGVPDRGDDLVFPDPAADIYAGGYGSQYSGRVASVVDVRTRNGNKKEMEGKVAVTPFVNTLQLEGPIIPRKLSFLASARRSAVEAVASEIVSQPMPYSFGDVFA